MVAAMMIVQGVLEGMIAFLFAVQAALWFFVVAQPAKPEAPDESFMPYLSLISMASVLIPSVLHIWAGIQNFSFQSHTFGIVGLLSGLSSVYSIWCAPTGIALMILGLIVYLQSDTRDAFAQVEAGKSPDTILKMHQR